MRLLLPLSMLALTVGQALARPTQYQRPGSLEARGEDAAVIKAYQVLLFDALAFPDPDDPTQTKAQLQAFVSLPYADFTFSGFMDKFRLASKIQPQDFEEHTLQERTKLFGAVGIGGTGVKVTVNGCTPGTGTLERTSFNNLGFTSSTLSLGTCGMLEGAKIDKTAWRSSTEASVFYSPNRGYGVISDIDDTVKITNVLDKAETIKNTFWRLPKAVPGMPQLYSHLSKSLPDPLFVYISGSPYHIYPSLKNFIGESYPDARGPIFTQTLTPVDVAALNHFLTENLEATREHKLKIITETLKLYPKKRWLLVGDSTQKDPEVYANIYAENAPADPNSIEPNPIACIWIRRVQGGENDVKRFRTAFAGVPPDKWKVFNDDEIQTMQEIKVDEGRCS